MRGLPVSDRLPALEGIRGLLALYVLLGHIATMVDPSALAGKPSQAPAWMHQLFAPFAYGHAAVAGFIVLSGYCLQLSLYVSSNGLVKSTPRFFRRRALRLLPAYYACLVLSWLVCVTITEKIPGYPFQIYLPVTPDALASHAFLVHNLRPDWMFKINGVLWTIAIEVQIYLFFPIIAWLLHRTGRIVPLLATSLLPVIVASFSPQWPKHYAWFLPLFTLGMVAASLVYRPIVRTTPRAWVGWATALIGAAAFWILNLAGQPLWWKDVATGWIVVGVASALSLDPEGIASRLLGSKWMAGLGAMSYSLYLMHHPIQQVGFWWLGGPQLDAVGKLAVLSLWSPVIIAGCWAFFRAFEMPVLEKPQWGARSESGQEGRKEFPLTLPLRAIEEETSNGG